MHLKTPPGPPRPAVYFDRDDTLIENATLPSQAFAGKAGDLVDPAWIRLLPGAAEAVTRVRELGFVVVIVTNQGVVARGGASIGEVEAACLRVHELLGERVAATFACPYHPSGSGPAEFCREHPWRKPNPGMLLAAAEMLHLDLTQSWLIGDAPRDLDAARAAGLPPERALLVAAELSLMAAVDHIAQALVARDG